MDKQQKIPKVTIYTSPGCGFCHMAMQYFDENNISYKTKDIATDSEAMQFVLEKVGQAVAPIITIDDTIIVGFDRPKIAEALGL